MPAEQPEATKKCLVCGKELYRPLICPRCGGEYCRKHIHNHGCEGKRPVRKLLGPALAAGLVVLLLLAIAYFYSSRFVPSGSFFGVNGHIPSEEAIAMMKDAGIGWVRVDFDWPVVESEEGSFSFDRYEKVYEACNAHGLQILGILTYCPPWASSAPPNSSWKTVAHSPPKNVERFSEYVGKTVKHFAGRIKYWEIWNEPNIGFFLGTADQYRSVLEAAYAAAKEADPNCIVLFGGTAGFGFDFINQVCSRAGARRAFDILNVHDYPPFPEGNSYKGLVNATKLARRLGKKEVWVTETGRGGYGEEQAAFLARTLLISLTLRKKGINRVFWYQMFHDDTEAMGLLSENGTRKASFYAYRTLAHLLRGAEWSGSARTRSVSSDEDGRVFALKYRTANATIISVWRNTTLPFFGKEKRVEVLMKSDLVRAVDMYEKEINVTRSGKWVEIPCSWKPVYLITRRR